MGTNGKYRRESEIANFQARQNYGILDLVRLASVSPDFIGKVAEMPRGEVTCPGSLREQASELQGSNTHGRALPC